MLEYPWLVGLANDDGSKLHKIFTWKEIYFWHEATLTDFLSVLSACPELFYTFDISIICYTFDVADLRNNLSKVRPILFIILICIMKI